MKLQKVQLTKYEYTLETLSSVVITPRSSSAFYHDIDFTYADLKNEDDNLNNKYIDLQKIKIIYPFYQYGVYDKYSHENAKYYLPGSSIKGALCSSSSSNNDVNTNACMVDDISLSKDDIVLRNLYKVTYLHPRKNSSENKDIKFEPFFESIGVEMIKANRILTGTCFANDEIINKILNTENIVTKSRIEEMIDYMTYFSKATVLTDLSALRKYNDVNRKLLPVLNKYARKLEKLIDLKEQNIILLGGYKGLLLSINESISDVDKGAIYLDPETHLPHGLVRITFKK